MKNTKIEWCDRTWNPVTGCFHGCEYCYAKKIAERFKGCDSASTYNTYGYAKWKCVKQGIGMENALFETDEKRPPVTVKFDAKRQRQTVKIAPYPWGFNPTLHRHLLKQPEVWHEPRVIFVCSMADLFGAWVPDEWIDEVFKACEEAPQHTYLFLTKNPSRYCQLDDAGKLPHKENWWFGSTWTKPGNCIFTGGVGTNTFVSIEPLLAEPDIIHGTGVFDWMIIGAETGNRKEKVIPKKEWIEKLCWAADNQANCPVFMKDSLIPIVGEENMRREFPAAMKMALGVGK